jgi:hypothetical protein
MKNFMGVPDYLPDTELERLNTKVATKVETPKVYSYNPTSLRKKAKEGEDQE